MFSPDGTLISATAAPHCGVVKKNNQQSNMQLLYVALLHLAPLHRAHLNTMVILGFNTVSRLGYMAHLHTKVVLVLYYTLRCFFFPRTPCPSPPRAGLVSSTESSAKASWSHKRFPLLATVKRNRNSRGSCMSLAMKPLQNHL